MINVFANVPRNEFTRSGGEMTVLNKVGLTDEEIKQILASFGFKGKELWEDFLPPVIAEAQLRKVVEWGDRFCFEHKWEAIKRFTFLLYRRQCPKCWQALLEEIK